MDYLNFQVPSYYACCVCTIHWRRFNFNFGTPFGFFWMSVKYCCLVFKYIQKNLTKVKWKIKTYILLFQTQKKNYQKDKCLIQCGVYKGWYIQCHNPNHPKKTIIMDFFCQWNWKLNLQLFTTTHWSTITLKMKKSNKKKSLKKFKI